MARLPRLTLVEEDEAAQMSPPLNTAPVDLGPPAQDDGPPAENVGQELQKARQQKGKELKDISRVLKIRMDYLAAIEEGKFERLPDSAHTLGFVRSYAGHLGLNAKDIAGRMKEEMTLARGFLDGSAGIDPLPQSEYAPQQDGPQTGNCADNPRPAVDFLPEPERESRLAGRLIAGAMLIALIYSVYSLSGFPRHMALKTVDPVPVRVATLTDVTQQPSVERAPEIAQPPASVPPLETAQSATPVPPPEPALPSATKLPPTQPVAVPGERAPRVIAPLPRGRQYGSANKTSRILLRMHRATRVTVEGDRKRIFIDRILEAGDSYRVPNMAGLRLTAQDAGAVEFVLDGSSMGFAGKDGAAAGLALNPQTIIARRRRG
jgi:cytoskeleton protein RodZ